MGMSDRWTPLSKTKEKTAFNYRYTEVAPLGWDASLKANKLDRFPSRRLPLSGLFTPEPLSFRYIVPL